MKLTRPDLAAYALVALCVVVVAALVALGKSIPELLSFVAVTALGAGAGVAAQPRVPDAAADQPAPAAPAAPAYDPAATGVMRVATHNPS